jgi:hypothetical protein
MLDVVYYICLLSSSIYLTLFLNNESHNVHFSSRYHWFALLALITVNLTFTNLNYPTLRIGSLHTLTYLAKQSGNPFAPFIKFLTKSTIYLLTFQIALLNHAKWVFGTVIDVLRYVLTQVTYLLTWIINNIIDAPIYTLTQISHSILKISQFFLPYFNWPSHLSKSWWKSAFLRNLEFFKSSVAGEEGARFTEYWTQCVIDELPNIDTGMGTPWSRLLLAKARVRYCAWIGGMEGESWFDRVLIGLRES